MPKTTLEATGGQSSLDYDLLDRSSQEAIFEIYQQLQDGGDLNLLEQYESMVSKIIRDVNSRSRAFDQEKTDLEHTLKAEKEKYNSYLQNLENDVELQIKGVEQNVKKELDEKHQRELDNLRKQMEARMAELHENVVKFNEESARMSAAAALTSVTAARRGSVTTNELASMKSQVTDLTDQSNLLRDELSSAQAALAEYRLQVQELISQQQQQQHSPSDRHLSLEINNSRRDFSQSPRSSRSYLNMAQLEMGQEDNSLASRQSSRYSSNFANNSTGDGSQATHQLAHSAISPSGGDDSGVGGATWRTTPINMMDANECQACGGFQTRDASKMVYDVTDIGGYGDDNLAAVLARDGYAEVLQTGEDKTDNGEITPPEFMDPNHLPEHVQFKLERFQQSLLMAADQQVVDSPSSEGNHKSMHDFVEQGHRHRPLTLAPSDPTCAAAVAPEVLANKRLSSYSGASSGGRNSITSPNNRGAHLFRKASPMSQSSSSKYAPDALVPRSRGAVATNAGLRAPIRSINHSGSMNSLLQTNSAEQQQQLQPGPIAGRSASSFDDECSLPMMARQASIMTESTIFGGMDGTNSNYYNKSISSDPYARQPRHNEVLTSVGDKVVSTIALEPERVFRVILAGDSAVGKSSILMRLVEDRFVNNLPTTLGVDFFTRLFQIDDDEQRTVALQLWDTAGQERFRSLARSYFRRADGVLLVYDVTSEKTFLSVRDWISIVRDSSDADVAIMICANKVDLRPFCANKNMRTVTTEDGQQLAESYNTLFIETSAKSGAGIIDGITELIRVMRTREDVSIRTAGLQLDEHDSKSRLHTFSCSSIGASASVKRPTCGS